jgi:carbon monoxide dehydrogenase subunit G
MRHLRIQEHIEAPIEHVWDLNASCERIPEWNVSVIEVKDCSGRLDQVGAKATTVAQVMGRRIEGQQETTRADRPRVLEQRLTGTGGATATFALTLAESKGGTDVTVEADYELPMGPFAGIAERILHGSIDRSFRQSMENFKALAEATVPAHA